MEHLRIPDKLYGRSQDTNKLLESFLRVSGGQGEILLLPGFSGVGKTALVQELRVPVRYRNGYFIEGKFDQYKQNIPYYAFRQALSQLCLELQQGSEHQREGIKTEIINSVAGLGQLLVDMVPEFGSFLGVQPPLGEISPQEARHRFTSVFQNFLKVICRPEHPLVLFLDDWQWADGSSLELLKQMQVGISLRYLLVIMSYRDNEVDVSSPLLLTMDGLRGLGVPVNTLHVVNITVKDVGELLADTLDPAYDTLDGLAEYIHRKTQGNPFFLRTFLGFLNDFGLIWYDPPSKNWQWNLEKIINSELPDTAVDLFIMRLREFEPAISQLFSLAACLGNRFDLETLCIISGHQEEACKEMLFSDQAKNILLTVQGAGSGQPDETRQGNMTFRFLHDRVQQAAYSIIDPVDRPEILLRIGLLLLSSLNREQLDERLFEVMGNVNAGSGLIHDQVERLRMVELNVSAARKAFAATAYRSALQFYQAAHHFAEEPGLEQELWKNHHDLRMRLQMEWAECEFLEGDRLQAERCIRQAADHSLTPFEMAGALARLIIQYTLQARYEEAISTGRQALSTLGIILPDDKFDEARDHEIGLVRKAMNGRQVASLFELQVMSDPEMLMASKILIILGPPCYRYHQKLWSVIVPKVVNLTLNYGNIPQVGYSHPAFGGLLGWVDDDYSTAKEFGELTTRLMTSTFRNASDQSVFYLMAGSSVRHWFSHLKYSSHDYLDAFEIGLRSGNLQYAAYAFGHNMYCSFFQGITLETLIQESQRSLAFSRNRLNQWAIDLLSGGIHIFSSLSLTQPGKDYAASWSEEEYLRQVEGHRNIQVTCIYKVLKAFSFFLLNGHEQALKLSDEAEPLIYTVGTQGLLPWPEHVFLRILILAALYPRAEKDQQVAWREQIEEMKARLHIWAGNCRENFMHKYLLAEAETARIYGRPLDAMKLYDQAIEEARAGGFVQWEGIANERAYEFWSRFGHESLACHYRLEAYACYNRWGAAAKLSSMEKELSEIFAGKNLVEVSLNGLKEKENREVMEYITGKQITHFRHYSSEMQRSRLSSEAITHSEELAAATERLRVEVAERKRTEKMLLNSERRYKGLSDQLEAILDHIPGLVFYKDKENRFIRVNKVVADANRKTKGELEGKNLAELYSREIAEGYYRDDLEVITRGVAKLNILEPWETAEGLRWVNTSKIPVLDAGGEITGVIGISMDVTELVKAQDEISRKNAELSTTLAEKDKFFSVIAHDLRGPFSSFLGLTRLMVEDLPTLRLDEIQKIALSMRHAANHLYALLENLLDWSRMQRGLITFDPEPLHLKARIRESRKSVIEMATKKNIHINLNIAEELMVLADRNMVGSVFRNLLSNAVKFTPQGGKVVVVAKNMDGEKVEISIKDTGIGMDDETLVKLFRIDEKTNRQGTDGEPSTGLGLLLCKEFIEYHGGKLMIDSEVGKGSTFSFTIPVVSSH